MYHGTTKEAFEQIKNDGILNAPVYLTPDFDTAADYAANNSADYVVITVDVDESLFCADNEFISGDDCLNPVEASLESGSVFIDSEVAIDGATFAFFEDYEEIEC